MENPSKQIKTLIHHILHKHKFYRFQMNTYEQMLILLHEQPINNPRLIQQAIFRGILNHNRRFKDNIAASLSDPRFDHIKIHIKQLLHRILHQFHFLYSIRAYEMFQPQYVQPGFNSSSTGSSKPPLDDDLERYKLHAMYYGPLSMYHIQQFPLPNANIFPPPLPGVAPQRSMFADNTQPSIFNNPTDVPSQRNMFDVSQRPTFYQAGFKSPQKQSKNISDKQLQVPGSMQIQRHFARQRGRPSKLTKKMIEKQNNRKLTTQISEILTRRLGNVQFLEERNDDLQFCACQGFVLQIQSKCVSCTNKFHKFCQGEAQSCLSCRMKDRDPFYKIDDVLVTSYIYDIENSKFEEQINMKEYYNMCQKTGRFQILVSCMRTGQEDQICWPDDCVFRINGQIVFEIPAMMVSHSVKRRADTAYQITPYIFREPKNEDHIGLQKTKFSLQWKATHSQPSRRNNRNSIFMLGIYVVKKITPQILFDLILQSNKDVPLEKPFQNDIDEPQIDRITVTYFDPFSGALIQTPSRGNLCKHLQCFDLQTFLAFTWASTERAWKCPFCGKDARKLIIDKFQLRILEQINDMDRIPLKVVYYRDQERIQFNRSKIPQHQSSDSSSNF